jgi:hypothetical protein
MGKIIETLRKTLDKSEYPAKSADAREWFQGQVEMMRGKINRTALLTDNGVRRVATPKPGYMYMYIYDPKYKDILPYYDRFPLVIYVSPDENGTGFFGLNLHYLNPNIRAIFLDTLFETFGRGDEPDENTRLRIRMSTLTRVRRMRQFAPCLKHYLFDHMVTLPSLVNPTDWEIAIFLPTEHFKGASRQTVWKESRSQYTRS